MHQSRGGLARTPPQISNTKRKLENVFDNMNSSDNSKYEDDISSKKIYSDLENKKENTIFGRFHLLLVHINFVCILLAFYSKNHIK
jgi:hypothetical protein